MNKKVDNALNYWAEFELKKISGLGYSSVNILHRIRTEGEGACIRSGVKSSPGWRVNQYYCELDKAIQSLCKIRKNLVKLRYLASMKHDEIMDALEIKKTTYYKHWQEIENFINLTLKNMKNIDN